MEELGVAWCDDFKFDEIGCDTEVDGAGVVLCDNHKFDETGKQ